MLKMKSEGGITQDKYINTLNQEGSVISRPSLSFMLSNKVIVCINIYWLFVFVIHDLIPTSSATKKTSASQSQYEDRHLHCGRKFLSFFSSSSVFTLKMN